MAKYRILRGCHAEGHYPKGHPLAGTPIVYERGDVIETDNCLMKHDTNPGVLGNKFQLIDDDRILPTDKINRKPAEEVAQAPADSDGLDRMTTAEIKELARGDGIDLGTAKTKADMIKVIRDAYAAA